MNEQMSGELEGIFSTLEGPEIIVDDEHVCVPHDKYEELIRAKVTLELIEKLFRGLENFHFDSVMGVIFPARKRIAAIIKDGEANGGKHNAE